MLKSGVLATIALVPRNIGSSSLSKSFFKAVHISSISDENENVAEFSMSNAAANEVRELSKCQHDLICDCEVSLDGTWQKRGHASLNGVTTAIANVNGK